MRTLYAAAMWLVVLLLCAGAAQWTGPDSQVKANPKVKALSMEKYGIAVSAESEQMDTSGKIEPSVMNEPQALKQGELLAIGDSLTEGVGDKSGGGYVEQVRLHLEEAQARPLTLLNLGKNGIRSDQLLDNLEKDETQFALRQAQCVLLSIGGNDLMHVVKANFLDLALAQFEEALTEYEQNLMSIMDQIRAENGQAPVYILGLFNPFQLWFADLPEMALILEAWNGAIQTVAGQYEDVFFVQIDHMFEEHGADMLGEDFFHPNAAGYDWIAKQVLRVMAQSENRGNAM